MIRLISFSSAVLAVGVAFADPARDYAENCAACHGADRLGGTGPALIPQTLKRMRGPKIEAVITDGRVATQMPGFSDAMTPEAITALATYLKTPLETVPDWGPDQITATIEVNPDYTKRPDPSEIVEILENK